MNRAQASTTGTERIRPGNEDAARTWDLGGSAYDDISFGISDALTHAVQRLNPRPGQEILDIATGTGWSARNAARYGARVTGVDIAPALLRAAESMSGHIQPRIRYQVADAEDLPFPDAHFDGVISTFGIMFAPDQARAAGELARVCRPGGRVSLAAWAPDGAVQEFFGLIGQYSDAPAPEPSPLAWGQPEHVGELLGDAFDLIFEPAVSNHYFDSVDDAWDWYARGFGPIKQVLGELDEQRQQAFRRDIDAYHGKFASEAGLHIRREYVLVIGRRRQGAGTR